MFVKKVGKEDEDTALKGEHVTFWMKKEKNTKKEKIYEDRNFKTS